MIDLHCHILPGVDDGVKTLEDAVEMARVAVAQGVRKIVATPHIFRDNLNWGDIAGLDDKRSQLVDEIQNNGIQVEILPGAEVHISHDLIEAVRKNRAQLVINRTSYMFVEFPAGHVYSNVKNLFFELMTEGITPIITHPERNDVFVHSPGRLYELIQMGALAQANSGSFLGLYGDKTEKAVLQFLELNLIHLIGSDSHGPRSLSWRLRDAVAKAGIVVGEEQAQALVEENPQAVVDNKELPFLLPATNPKKGERSFSMRIPKIFKGGH